MPKTSTKKPLDFASNLTDVSLEDRLHLVRVCCQHASEAGAGGRLRAAHGLFQTALLFFEQAKTLALPENETKLGLLRQELELSALLVYPPSIAYSAAELKLLHEREQ